MTARSPLAHLKRWTQTRSLQSPIPWQIAAVGLAILITYGSLQPMTGKSGIAHADKIMHLLGYGALAGLIGLGWPRWSWIRVLITAALFGIAIELAQGALTAGRTPSVLDAIANTIGAALAVGCLSFLRRP